MSTDTRQALADLLRSNDFGPMSCQAGAISKCMCLDCCIKRGRAALAAQPVAGAVATDETGWLIEHSGEILPGAEQRAQVSWLRVQMKFNGYGAREFGFTHDANEALRFARKEDAEAVLAMHLGASPPDWYSKPFSVTEHMWPLVPQAQAAPAPEPSAQAVREPGDPLHDDAYVRGVAVGFVEDDSRRTTLLRIADRMQKLAAAPQPAPSAQAVAHPSHQTVREWMPVSEALRLSDLWTAGDLDNCGQWRAAIKVLADEVRALAASPQPEPSAQGEPVACDRDAPVCPWCDRQGLDICQHADDARTCGK